MERKLWFGAFFVSLVCVSVVAGTVLLFYMSESGQQCGIENCHGLDISCGPDAPEVCTEIYQIGDRCRQYASCEIIDGECQMVWSERFVECKSCVEKCLEDFMDGGDKAFECESRC